ncbi:mitochondrial fusion (Ugo1) [Cordyceps militaris]|uniref:Mitochondrial fusion (Ugo1) n=1 Tax=Cordyceps militaris TaxID=73501 RepID=A0A2H4SEL5_CORMI|nr:mitochondrial fusion (Ugo1) [Cordyceps militaris]
MTSHGDGVNPLRPYYIRPSIGERVEPAAPGPKAFSSSSARNATASSAVATSSRYASRARDMFADLDYNGYMDDDTPSMTRSVKELLDDLVWKYTSVLMAQPFEVAKTILQARNQDEKALLSESVETEVSAMSFSSQGLGIPDHDSDSEGDESTFFTYNGPDTPASTMRGSLTERRASPLTSPKPVTHRPVISEHYIPLRRPDSVTEVIGHLWQKNGAFGVWKASNATFLYTVLHSLLENWSRSFLSAVFNVPDLGLKEDIDRIIDIATPYPWASLFIAATAAVVTGLALAPLDLVRTRLIMTPSSKGPRRTLATLRALPSYFINSMLAIPTILNSLIHPLFTLSTPLLLRTKFLLDKQASPMTFSAAKFLASTTAILVKLPLETVLRRGQMAVLSSPEYIRALAGKDLRMETIVPIGPYRGVLGTMYHITSNEGSRTLQLQPPIKGNRKANKARPQTPLVKNGQGLDGLWRGWKVNWWGLVGLWAANVIGNGGDGEF